MIQINVKTNGTRRTVNKEVSATPQEVFDEIGVSASNAQVNINGRIISASSMDKSFAALGIEDGSVVNLNSVVKADGAAV